MNDDTGNDRIKIGQHYTFEHPYPLTMHLDPGAESNHGKQCLVVSASKGLVAGRYRMYCVLFPNGFHRSVLEYELHDADCILSKPEGDDPTRRLDLTDWIAIDRLRSRGFAVAIFNPDEIGSLRREDVEQEMVAAGNKFIDDNEDAEEDED